MLRWKRIEISGGFLLLAAGLYYLDTQGVVLWAALAAALHELGHYVVIRLFGGRVTLLRLTCVGAEMVLSARRPLSLSGQLCAALTGPVVNLALAFSGARLADGERGYLFAGLNLALGLFNLLPAAQLDGGRALRCVLLLLGREEGADRAVRAVSAGLALALVAAGVFALGSGGNVTLLLTALWLLSAAVLPGEDEKRKKRRRRRKICLHSR